MTRSGVERLDEAFTQNPYPVYERLRAEGPVSRVLMPGGQPVWVVTRYAEARAALADPRLVKDWRKVFPQNAGGGEEEFSALDAHLLSTDPPDHERLRRLVSKAFTARRIEQLRPRVTEITGSLLAAMKPGTEVDLLAALAFPLPITVICELLGIPDADRDDFRAWTQAILSPEATDSPDQAAAAMTAYFTALIASKRAQVADDLLSGLIAAHDAGDRLSEHELLGMMFRPGVPSRGQPGPAEGRPRRMYALTSRGWPRGPTAPASGGGSRPASKRCWVVRVTGWGEGPGRQPGRRRCWSRT